MSEFFPTIEDARDLCIACYYARERDDICGIYCTTGFVENGVCEMFVEYEEEGGNNDR